jgi:hypothetical protein
MADNFLTSCSTIIFSKSILLPEILAMISFINEKDVSAVNEHEDFMYRDKKITSNTFRNCQVYHSIHFINAHIFSSLLSVLCHGTQTPQFFL